jgi:hypothetical protein
MKTPLYQAEYDAYDYNKHDHHNKLVLYALKVNLLGIAEDVPHHENNPQYYHNRQ